MGSTGDRVKRTASQTNERYAIKRTYSGVSEDTSSSKQPRHSDPEPAPSPEAVVASGLSAGARPQETHLLGGSGETKAKPSSDPKAREWKPGMYEVLKHSYVKEDVDGSSQVMRNITSHPYRSMPPECLLMLTGDAKPGSRRGA